MTARLIWRLAMLVVVLFALSLLAGKVWLSPSLIARGGMPAWVVIELRLPRALLAVLIGSALGLSGAVMQGYVRNPLADPSLLGIASSAALGAVAMLFVSASASPALIFVAAMAGAGLATLVLMAMTQRSGGATGFVLGGMVLSSLSGALTAFLISVAPNPFALGEIMNWIMGALTDRDMSDVARAAGPIIAGCALLLGTARALNALTLGEATAQSLGIDARRLRWQVVAGLCLTVGASVAVAGVVGFVGLIVPHLVRRSVGSTPSATLIPSALGGAALVLAADTLVRLTPGAGEVRLGVVMAMIGAPFFFALLWRERL